MEFAKFSQLTLIAVAATVPATRASAEHATDPANAQRFANPYSGMYGSMGNVYSPYYRKLHPYGMGGMSGAPQMPAMAGMRAQPNEYIMNPYSSMYGSMGNVYSPYYRSPGSFVPGGTPTIFSPPIMPQPPGMSSMSGMTGTATPPTAMSMPMGMQGMGGQSGYFHITPYGQIFFYPQR